MEVKQATTQKEIEAIIDLRDKILRKPWDQPRETATDEERLHPLPYGKLRQRVLSAIRRLRHQLQREICEAGYENHGRIAAGQADHGKGIRRRD